MLQDQGLTVSEVALYELLRSPTGRECLSNIYSLFIYLPLHVPSPTSLCFSLRSFLYQGHGKSISYCHFQLNLTKLARYPESEFFPMKSNSESFPTLQPNEFSFPCLFFKQYSNMNTFLRLGLMSKFHDIHHWSGPWGTRYTLRRVRTKENSIMHTYYYRLCYSSRASEGYSVSSYSFGWNFFWLSSNLA